MDPQFAPRTREGDSSIGPFDAVVLAVTRDLVSATSSSKGLHRAERWVITTPNMQHIPEVKLGTQHVHARRDGRFGFNDFTLVPQIFCGEFAHHCCAPARPEDLDAQHRGILWATPTRQHFVPVKGSLFEGLGNLQPEYVDKFSRMYDTLYQRAKDFKIAAVAENGMSRMVAGLVSALRLALVRLRCAPCTFHDLVLQVADFQRRYIDLESFLLYYTKFQGRQTLPLEQRTGDVHEVDTTLMGAVCFQPSNVQWLFEAGIPVWYLRPESTITPHTNIIAQVDISPPHPPLCLSSWKDERGIEIPSKIIYVGFPGQALQMALRKASQHLNDSPNPTEAPVPPSSEAPVPPSPSQSRFLQGTSSSSLSWASPPVTATPSSSSSSSTRSTSFSLGQFASVASSSTAAEDAHTGPAPTSGGVSQASASTESNRKRKRDPYQGRNDFEEPVSNIMPPPIPVWQEALAQLDEQLRSKKGNKKHAGQVKRALAVGYHFPNPRTFVGTSSSRLESYLVCWLASRAAWMYKVTTEAYAGKLLSATGAQWRDWLSCVRLVENPAEGLSGSTWKLADPNAGGSGSSRAASSRAAAWQMFRLYMPEAGFPDRVFWHERELQAGNMHALEPEVTAEILWDLFEHNFRFEVVALDRAQLESKWQDEDWARERDELLRSLFPGGIGYLVEGRPTRNAGLAVEDWRERAPYLRIFCDIVNLWPNPPKHLNALKAGPGTIDYRDILTLEKVVVAFYCRTFHATFGRAPIAPHRLPPRRN